MEKKEIGMTSKDGKGIGEKRWGIHGIAWQEDGQVLARYRLVWHGIVEQGIVWQ